MVSCWASRQRAEVCYFSQQALRKCAYLKTSQRYLVLRFTNFSSVATQTFTHLIRLLLIGHAFPKQTIYRFIASTDMSRLNTKLLTLRFNGLINCVLYCVLYSFFLFVKVLPDCFQARGLLIHWEPKKTNSLQLAFNSSHWKRLLCMCNSDTQWMCVQLSGCINVASSSITLLFTDW